MNLSVYCVTECATNVKNMESTLSMAYTHRTSHTNNTRNVPKIDYSNHEWILYYNVVRVHSDSCVVRQQIAAGMHAIMMTMMSDINSHIYHTVRGVPSIFYMPSTLLVARHYAGMRMNAGDSDA